MNKYEMMVQLLLLLEAEYRQTESGTFLCVAIACRYGYDAIHTGKVTSLNRAGFGGRE
jgi:hypothetical protein